MSCYKPLHGFPYPSNTSRAGQYMVYPGWIDKPPVLDESTGEFLEQIDIRCGHCVGCRLDYSKQWATRMVMESLQWPKDTSYFVTLTYSEDFVPKNEEGTLVLDPGAVSSWMKRLRRIFDYRLGHKGIRFYACGEYGPSTLRPHYHACIFNAPFNDLEQIGVNKLGFPLYESKLLNDSWSYEVTSDQRLPLGHVCLGRLTWQTCAYTARYTLKKATGQDAVYFEELNMVPEFVRMSRRPGIGVDYFLSHKNSIYECDKIILPAISKDKPLIQSIPRYFDLKMAEIDPLRVAEAKYRRRIAGELAREAKLSQVGLEEEEYFELEERLCTERLKKLVREL